MSTLESVKQRLLGNKFGKLTILEYVGRTGYRENQWRCRCDCGNEVISVTDTVSKPTSACKECRYETSEYYSNKSVEHLGRKFGRFTVIACEGRDKHSQIRWTCQCECGNTRSIRTGDLGSKRYTSCGCYAKELAKTSNRTHGLHNHKLYYVWSVMKDRLTNKNNKRFHRYGGRGIGLHPDWRDNFKSFYDWAMANGYQPGLTLERKDNDGNYEPNNCRWATRAEQMQNTSLTKITPDLVRMIKKDTRSNAALADAIGVNASTVSRIRNGKIWTNIQ